MTWPCDKYDIGVLQGLSIFNLLVKTKLWHRKDERFASEAFNLAMSKNMALSYKDTICKGGRYSSKR
jgi:hypothetical protein